MYAIRSYYADDFVREVTADLGDDLPTATVKRVLGPSAVLSLSLAEAGWQIQDAAERGMRVKREPYRAASPARIELDFHRRRITSYNVCYTKLLRMIHQDFQLQRHAASVGNWFHWSR